MVGGGLAPSLARPQADYVIGAKPFAEQYILAALIEQRLQASGATTARRDGLGSSIIFAALAAGEIDAYVDYTGTIWANEMHRTDVKPRAQVLDEVTRWLESTHRITVLGGLGFENAYTLAMSKRRAQELGIHSIADLAGHAADFTIAGDYEFFGRPEWQALRDAYGLSFRAQRQMQAEFMYPAVAAGEVDVIAGYSSDGRISQFDLITLDDPKQAIPPYDAILMFSPKRKTDTVIRAALQPLVGSIGVELMRAANQRASGNESPAAVARWLWGQIERQSK
jgi:osmoprotectant transport system permease protein